MSTLPPLAEIPQHASVTRVRGVSVGAPKGLPGFRHGYCIARPEPGERLVMYNENGRRRIVTTPVLRLLVSRGFVYVQTENSTYRLEPATRDEIEAAIVEALARGTRSNTCF